MEELVSIKVLFLIPSFFGYEIEIKKELEVMGAEVFIMMKDLKMTS